MSLDTILLVDLGIYTSGTGTRGHQLFAVPQYLRVPGYRLACTNVSKRSSLAKGSFEDSENFSFFQP